MAKGLYTPVNLEKYLGDPAKIRFLSRWELRFMVFCDTNRDVIAWGSEEIKLAYAHPIKNRVAMYIPDFVIKFKDKDDRIRTEIVEIKPMKETVLTERSSNYDKISIAVNHAKWAAAEAFCAQNGMKFRVLTEQSIFAGGKKAPSKKTKPSTGTKPGKRTTTRKSA
jgi:hypothetical protein